MNTEIGLQASLSAITVPDALQHASRKSETEDIPRWIRVALAAMENMSLVTTSQDEPNVDQRAFPWIKISPTGQFIGVYCWSNVDNAWLTSSDASTGGETHPGGTSFDSGSGSLADPFVLDMAFTNPVTAASAVYDAGGIYGDYVKVTINGVTKITRLIIPTSGAGTVGDPYVFPGGTVAAPALGWFFYSDAFASLTAYWWGGVATEYFTYTNVAHAVVTVQLNAATSFESGTGTDVDPFVLVLVNYPSTSAAAAAIAAAGGYPDNWVQVKTMGSTETYQLQPMTGTGTQPNPYLLSMQSMPSEEAAEIVALFNGAVAGKWVQYHSAALVNYKYKIGATGRFDSGSGTVLDPYLLTAASYATTTLAAQAVFATGWLMADSNDNEYVTIDFNGAATKTIRMCTFFSSNDFGNKYQFFATTGGNYSAFADIAARLNGCATGATIVWMDDASGLYHKSNIDTTATYFASGTGSQGTPYVDGTPRANSAAALAVWDAIVYPWSFSYITATLNSVSGTVFTPTTFGLQQMIGNAVRDGSLAKPWALSQLIDIRCPNAMFASVLYRKAGKTNTAHYMEWKDLYGITYISLITA